MYKEENVPALIDIFRASTEYVRGSRRVMDRSHVGIASVEMKAPDRKVMGNLKKLDIIWASGTHLAEEEARTPRAEKVNDESAMAMKTSGGLAMDAPEKSMYGAMNVAAITGPKNDPASTFPRTRVVSEIGAAINLSKVPDCFSSTTATASIDIVPNKMTREVKPEKTVTGSICPDSENARYSEMGIRRP